MKVVWADETLAHLAGIHDFIKHNAPFYATQTIDKLTRRVEQLIAHPSECARETWMPCRESRGAGAHLRLRCVKAPTSEALTQLTQTIARRVARCLERQGSH